MHIFMDNFQQGGRYSDQIASHQAELRIEENLLIRNLYLFHPYRLISSGCGINSEKANTFQTKCNFFGGANHSAGKKSKGSEKKRENLVRLVIQTIDVQNVCLRNFLDVDLKIA